MNYKHLYHAGNFADVVKHVFLIDLLQSLLNKPKPFCYLDTHAGSGCYDLFSTSAGKNKEFLGGIQKIVQSKNQPPLIKTYLDCINQINAKMTPQKNDTPHYYPGSPLIAHYFLRPMDQMILCELQHSEYDSLKKTLANNKQIHPHHMDGYLGLKSFLPPIERRGLILIDPSYETPTEFTHLIETLPIALKRFKTGIYMVWYPIKEKNALNRFYEGLKKQIDQPIFIIELTIYPDLPQHLNGCGLAIINPPWQFDVKTAQLLPSLWNSLTINHQGAYRHFFLK